MDAGYITLPRKSMHLFQYIFDFAYWFLLCNTVLACSPHGHIYYWMHVVLYTVTFYCRFVVLYEFGTTKIQHLGYRSSFHDLLNIIYIVTDLFVTD